MARTRYDVDDVIFGHGASYRVEKVLGAGGMGEVYKARDRALGLPVVVKILHAHLATTAYRERFEQEPRVIALIGQQNGEHPNLVRVLHLSELSDAVKTPFFVMEWVPGSSLKSMLQEHRKFVVEAGRAQPTGIRIDRALNIAIDALHGLEAVHDHGIAHLDIKPANLVLSVDVRGRNVAKLIDFGVVRVMADEVYSGFTGTPSYAAPEQIKGFDAGPAADLFAMGIVAFEMLTGRHPFERAGGGEAGAVLRADQRAPSLASYGEFPPALERLVARMLAVAPGDRPKDAFSVYRELENILNALGPIDVHGAITDQNLAGIVADDELRAIQTITKAHLAAPTDPDVSMPELMRHLRSRTERAELLGFEEVEDAERYLPSGSGSLGTADTEPMRMPPNGTSPMPGRRAVVHRTEPLPHRVPIAVADATTNPPSQRAHAYPMFSGLSRPGTFPPLSARSAGGGGNAGIEYVDDTSLSRHTAMIMGMGPADVPASVPARREVAPARPPPDEPPAHIFALTFPGEPESPAHGPSHSVDAHPPPVQRASAMRAPTPRPTVATKGTVLARSVTAAGSSTEYPQGSGPVRRADPPARARAAPLPRRLRRASEPTIADKATVFAVVLLVTVAVGLGVLAVRRPWLFDPSSEHTSGGTPRASRHTR